MATVYGPGTYYIKLNDSGKPSLFGPDRTTPIDDPQFETSGNASFFFQIFDTGLMAFNPERPVTWKELESKPLGNSYHIVKGMGILILNVTPPLMAPVSTTYHFTLHLDVGDVHEVLWTADGSLPLDPTVIENPPNG